MQRFVEREREVSRMCCFRNISVDTYHWLKICYVSVLHTLTQPVISAVTSLGLYSLRF